jgi:hypothetical protein
MKPETETLMVSVGPLGRIITCALAIGRQLFAPLETTISKRTIFLFDNPPSLASLGLTRKIHQG